MIDDLLDQVVDALNDVRAEVDSAEAEVENNKYREKRITATAAALKLCPENIRDWLIRCTATEAESNVAYSNADVYNSDGVEWFDVGHNSTHYFSFGVRLDGVFVAKTCGPEYSEECQCWYDSTTISVVTPENVCHRYWGHM